MSLSDWIPLIGIGMDVVGMFMQKKAADKAAEQNRGLAVVNAELYENEAKAALEIAGYNASALEAEGQTQLDIANFNAAMKEEEGWYKIWRARYEEGRMWDEVSRVIGKQTVAAAGAGIAIGSKTVQRIKKDSLVEAALDAYVIRKEAQWGVWSSLGQSLLMRAEGQRQVDFLKNQATIERRKGELLSDRYKSQAKIVKQEGDIRYRTAKDTGTAALITGGSRILNRVIQWRNI